LREKKFARTKIALMNAFIERLRKARFDDISVKEVCQSAEISEGTFFNYFPEKIDVITYYANLMTIGNIWKARQKSPAGRYIPLLNAFFGELADHVEAGGVDITYEFISIMVVRPERPRKNAISNLEKRLFFPELDGIEDIDTFFMDEFFRDCLEKASKNGELPVNSGRIDNVLVSLLTIMIGTLIAVKFGHDAKNLKNHYQRHLHMLWHELGIKKQ